VDADRRSDVLVDAVTSVLIHLGRLNLNRACIASHVGGGSHPVPADRGISRNPRMLEPSGLRQLLAAGSIPTGVHHHPEEAPPFSASNAHGNPALQGLLSVDNLVEGSRRSG
jgi:hypothetical protein